MDWWQDDFCARLAAGPRYVIRYDHRDTGQSTSYPPGAPGYTGDDLVADAAALLDVLGVAPAHVVGQSMGGALAQLMALDHPERVASLTLVATSPAGPGDADLPPMTDEARAAFAAIAEPDWSDRAAVIDYLTEQWRALASRSRPFDEEGTRALCARVVDRTTNIESSTKNALRRRGKRPLARAPRRARRADARRPRDRGPALPARPRRGAGARDPRRRAARAGGSGPRAGRGATGTSSCPRSCASRRGS